MANPKMKIAEIPKVIPTNGFVCVSLKNLNEILDHYRDSYGLNLNPDFQRPHVWSESLQIKFVEFILKGGDTLPILFNSPVYAGANRSKNSDLPDDIVLVDGKQRLTAILKFIDNKLPVFGGVYLNDFDEPKILLRGCIIRYSVNCLQTRKEVLQWYLQLNEGHVAHSTDELTRIKMLIDNLDYD